MPKERTPNTEILVLVFILIVQIKGIGSSAKNKSDTIAKADKTYEVIRAPGAQVPPSIVRFHANSIGWQRKRL